VSHYKIVLQKSLPRPTIYRQKSARPAAARAGRISTGKMSAGKDFSKGGGRSYNGETFYGAGDLLIKKETYQFRDYLSPDRFFMQETS